MSADSLQQLEKKINRLIVICDQLQAENSALRDRENNLQRERSKLIEKNDLARTRVEAMISRLKNLEVDG